MKKNSLWFASIVYFCILPLNAVIRDPFACIIEQQNTMNVSKKKVLATKEATQNDLPQEQWTVKQMRKNAVVLQDAQGNIREISFSDEERKPFNSEKAEGLGGNNT